MILRRLGLLCRPWFRSVAVVIIVCAYQRPSRCCADEVSIDILRDAAKAMRERLQTVDVTYTIELTGHPLKRESSPGETSRVRIDTSKGRYNLHKDLLLSESQRAAVRRGVLRAPVDDAWDGELISTLDALTQSGSIGAPRSGSQPRKIDEIDKFISISLRHPPKESGLGVDDGSLESFLQRGVLQDDVVDIEGHPCVAVDCFLPTGRFEVDVSSPYATVYIDTAHGFVVRKILSYKDAARRLNCEVVVHEVGGVKDSSGAVFWLPVRATTRTFGNNQLLEEAFRVDLEKLRINPALEGKDFRVDFPDGTRVFDFDTNTGFEVGIGKHGSIQQVPSNRRLWIIAINVIVITALLYIYLRSRRGGAKPA